MATDAPTVFNVVPGPGLLNATAALSTAYALNAKLFCLTGQINSRAIGKDWGELHEINDQLGVMRGLTKWADRATAPAEVPRLIHEAFNQMQSGRPRPVGLEIPMDVLAAEASVELLSGDIQGTEPELDEGIIEAAAKLLGQAKSPLIFVGSGAQGASALVRQLAETLQAPVVGYRTGMGVVDARSYLSLHQPAAKPLWDKADVVLAIGPTCACQPANGSRAMRLRSSASMSTRKHTTSSLPPPAPSPPAPNAPCRCCCRVLNGTIWSAPHAKKSCLTSKPHGPNARRFWSHS